METLAVQPLDMVKTRFQIREGANPSLLRGLLEVYREGGVFRFYRGMLPEMVSTAPARTAMYSGYTWTAHAVQGKLASPQLETFVAGLASGVPESVIVTPLQLVKVRLQAKEHLGRYKNAFHCLRTIIFEEGPRALFTGFSATVCRNCAWNSVYFVTQGELKRLLGEPKAETGGWGAHAFNLVRTSGCAFLAGAFATCFNAPFDVAKSRIQQQVSSQDALGGVGSAEPKYTGTLQALQLIWREEGLRGMYKGFVPKFWRMGLGGAVGMLAFETAQKFC